MSSTPFNIAATKSTSPTSEDSTQSNGVSPPTSDIVSTSPTSVPAASSDPVTTASIPISISTSTASLTENSPEVIKAYTALIKLDKVRIEAVWGRIMKPSQEPNAAELKLLGLLSIVSWHRAIIATTPDPEDPSTELEKLPSPDQLILYNNGNKLRHAGHTVDIKASSSNVTINGKDVTVRRLGGTIASIKNAYVVCDKIGAAGTGFI